MDMNLTKLQEIVRDRAACCAVVHGAQSVGNDLATEQQQSKQAEIKEVKGIPSRVNYKLLLVKSLPSASREIESQAVAAVDLQYALKAVQDGECDALCSKECGETSL